MNEQSIALLVIDMQKGIFNKKIKVFNEESLIINTNVLIDAFHKNSWNVYFIRHTNKNFLVENSADWQLHSDLHQQEGDVYANKEHSSAFKEKNIKKELEVAGIKHIIVAGLVTHGCVQASCLDAKKLGFGVTLAADAHSSYNKDAENLIVEWNKKLAGEGINVIKTDGMINIFKTL